nr:pilus assembly protein PilM [Candidatus Omnitrophota bacterium]
MGFDFKFITKEKLSVGLDIGTQSIKMVSLRLDREKAELYDFALEPNQPQSLSQALKRITQLQEAKRVNVSLSGLSTVTRYVAFPKMSAEELKQALKFEAQKHIPFTLNEVNMDAQPVPNTNMVIATATNHNGPCRGGIVLIDPTKGANAKEAITNLTPEVDIYAHRMGGGPFGNG